MAIKATTATTSTTTIEASPAFGGADPRLARVADFASFVLLIVVLAWAPFPLGSNRPWSWSLLCLLITTSWLCWVASVWLTPQRIARHARGLAPALVLGFLALCWAVVQVLPAVPSGWAHPVWGLASEVLGSKLSAVISLDPWRTKTELMKLLSYAMCFWLARVHAARPERANLLLRILVVIGALYAAYAIVLYAFGYSQLGLFYEGKTTSRDLSGPFVNHNSFATYSGLLALCAGGRLMEEVWSGVHLRNDMRRSALLLLQNLSGRAAPYLAAVIVLISAVIGTGSRGGSLATLVALTLALTLAGTIVLRETSLGRLFAASLAFCIIMTVLFAVNGDLLAGRITDMTTAGARDDTRVVLWNAAWRMIHDAPLLGLGLGTFESAYPMYSEAMMPLVMDKAHNDYLELAAGLGMAAAVLWWLAITYLTGLCLRGIRNRHRSHVFPVVGLGATVLVAVHSFFDFSLQMSAVAVTYAAILGLGVAQTFSSRVFHRAQAPLRRLGTWSLRLATIVPALVVIVLAGTRFMSGLAQDAVVPTTSRMLLNITLPVRDYGIAAQILTHVSSFDGGTQITRAVALEYAGAPPAVVLPVVEGGLRNTPSSARGWILLAEQRQRRDAARAADALALAIMLAPREQRLVRPRLLAAAPLFHLLPANAKAVLLDDIRSVVSRPGYDPTLQDVLSRPGGAELVTEALVGRPEYLRALNRRVAKERLGL